LAAASVFFVSNAFMLKSIWFSVCLFEAAACARAASALLPNLQL
jgi:hypothetical protein